MKLFILCLTLGVPPSFAGSRDVPIRIYTHFQQEPPDDVMASVQVEVDKIMYPIGLHLEWRSLAMNLGNEVSRDLAVVRFKGHCDTKDLVDSDGYPGPLGWTYLSDGEVIPFIGINCDGIRIMLQRSLIRIPEPARTSAYSNAVARVLAHELYHVFTRTTKHGSSGIAKSAYSENELLSDRFSFNKQQSDALRAYIARLAAMAPEIAGN